jgi:hypothetical protein
LSALWTQQKVDPRDRRCRIANRAMRMVYQLVGGRQLWRGKGVNREYLLAKLQEFHRVHKTPLEQAIRKNGFSLVEAVSYCHTTFGRINKLGTAVEMMRQLKDNSITRAADDKLTPQERGGKIVRGVLCDLDKPEYTALYDQVIERARADANGKPRTAGGL